MDRRDYPSARPEILNWKVMEEENLSDHRYTSFELNREKPCTTYIINETGWVIGKEADL